VTSMLAGAIRREPLAATDGRSGSLLERVTLAGGEAVVVKHARAAEGERHNEEALRLALLGGLVQLGWDKALHATGHPDAAVRARERADLDWWTARARDALERWSP
jgi:hypothetical protein